MKVLVLRTFAHQKVWDERTRCEYEPFQSELITQWDPSYLDNEGQDIAYALGIYTYDYFHRKRYYGKLPPAFTGTSEEQVPSVLSLRVEGDEKIARLGASGALYLKYEFTQKLWREANQSLMFELDNSLLGLKRKEISIHTPYPALSFSLEQEKVDHVFQTLGIKIPFS